MANLYEALQSVNFDGQSVQYLLESQGLSSDFSPNTDGTQEDSNPVDEDDLFQCGKCKKQFTSFQLFVLHKREHKKGHMSKLHNSNVLLPPEESRSSASETPYCHLQIETLGTESSPEIGNQIIFSENDILSFAVNQAIPDISTTTEETSPYSHVVQMRELSSTDPTENGTVAGSVLAEEEATSYSIAILGNQQADFCSSQFLGNSTSATLPSIHCLTKRRKMLKMAETVDGNNVDDVLLDAPLTESASNPCEILLPDLDCSARSSDSGLEKLMRCEEVPTDSTKTVLLNYCSGQTVKSCNLKCNFCTKLFTKNFDLQQHIRSHTGEKPFQCVICGRAFAQKSNVKKHMQAHKVWPKDQTTLRRKTNQLGGKENNAGTSQNVKAGDPTSEKNVDYPSLERYYSCQFCDTTFSMYIELRSHMKKHADQKVYKCIQKNCLQVFSDLESFLTHTNNAHVTGLQYRCHVCNKKFDNLEALGLHQYSHGTRAKSTNKSLTRGLICYKCKRKFKSHAALEHHLDTSSHHFPCTYCGKIFTWERYLRRHLTTHGPEESYPCPVCSKCFRTEPYLKAHMLIHSNVRPFVCQHCGATFNRRDKLARHLLIHQAVKKYKCPFHSYLGCSRAFSRQDKLKQHILTHTAPKSVRCRNCNKLFLKQSQLKDHEKLHCHKEQKQKCVDCGMVFRNKSLLSSHACKSVCHGESTKNVIGATGNSSQNFEGEIKKRKVSVSKTKGTKKNYKIRTADEVSDISLQSNSMLMDDSNACRNSVSTIEIIVLPVSVTRDKAAEINPEEKSVCIVYPLEETNSVPSELSNSSHNLGNYECENVMVSRREECVGSIPQLMDTSNSKNPTG